MNNIELSLMQLEGLLLTQNLKLLSTFQPGLPPDFITAELKAINITNKTIVSLYSWRNGNENILKPIGFLQFSSFGYMIPFDRALSLYQNVCIDTLSDRSLFPIIESRTGDYLLLDTKKENGALFHYSPSMLINEPKRVIVSFSKFIYFTLVCFGNSTYTIGENCMLNVDFIKEEENIDHINKARI